MAFPLADERVIETVRCVLTSWRRGPRRAAKSCRAQSGALQATLGTVSAQLEAALAEEQRFAGMDLVAAGETARRKWVASRREVERLSREYAVCLKAWRQSLLAEWLDGQCRRDPD